jgi:peptidoglycan/LPS O-acetylase OafA/YrhL
MERDEQDISPMAQPRAFPANVAPLGALQFVAIAWIVLNQFRFHLGLEAGARSGLVAKGYIGAGLFLVVGGFLVCRRYDQLRRAGRLRYGSFLWRRLSFTYPLHLLVIVAMATFLALGDVFGGPLHRASFNLSDLPANVLFIQAWGAVATDSWNFPSWLVSAEWFTCLMFPPIAWVALKGLRWASLAVAIPIALFVLGFALASRMGVLFTDMTARIGAIQALPAFLLGAGLWRLRVRYELTLLRGAAISFAALVWIVAAALLRLSDLVIWPAFAPLVFGVTHLAASPSLFGDWRPLHYLGRISVAMLLVYLPVDIAYFRVGRLLLGEPQGFVAWALLAGVFPAIVFAAMAAHHLVQRPLWVWLARHDPFCAKKG